VREVLFTAIEVRRRTPLTNAHVVTFSLPTACTDLEKITAATGDRQQQPVDCFELIFATVVRPKCFSEKHRSAP
jgi:hypothetical protein